MSKSFRKCHIKFSFPLGVVKDYRKNGIASFLLDNLVAHLTNPADKTSDVKVLYLHVLTTNNSAISFYENRGFRAHTFLPCYYLINGRRKDGFTYVLYLNGGHPSWRLGRLCQELRPASHLVGQPPQPMVSNQNHCQKSGRVRPAARPLEQNQANRPQQCCRRILVAAVAANSHMIALNLFFSYLL